MLQLTEIRKSYQSAGFRQSALNGVTITFRDNEFAAILGPSGSGKTTLLNVIGGLDRADAGEMTIDGVSTRQYQAHDWDAYRNNRIGFVFQSYNLIPHQSVLANVELALTLSGVPEAERRARARQALAEVGLAEHSHKRPNQLSGGQMQRVAIARALVNDPQILLADEPTGALDTQTGRQVMDLLAEIAKDRLVIMVTHNNELAAAYANRVVQLADGQITADSRPYDAAARERRGARPVRQARMSLPTAVKLSYSNLLTKKGRTLVTALAGSIGIIGIAAIIVLANGINVYIEDVERETLSIYPLTIQSAGFDFTNMYAGFEEGELIDSMRPEPGWDDSEGVYELRLVETLFSFQSQNDLASLKAYLETNAAEIAPYVSTIHYQYEITPQIYLADTSDGVEQVNPDALLDSYGLGAMGGMSALLGFGGMSAMNVFHELPGGRDMYESQYQLVAGMWPEQHDEAVLVLGADGGLSDFTLYAMGLRDRSRLEVMLEAFVNHVAADLEIDVAGSEFSYETLMSARFKVVSLADRYQYDETYGVWLDKGADEAFLRELVDAGLTLRIVGIVQPAENALVTTLSSGVNYTPGLVGYLMERAAAAPVVREQLARPELNVLTGATFAAENEASAGPAFDLADLITLDESALWRALQIDAARLNLDLSQFGEIPLDLSDLDLSAFDWQSPTEALAGQVGVPFEQISSIIDALLRDFWLEQEANGVTDPRQMLADLPAYLARLEVQAALEELLAQAVAPTPLREQLSEALQTYLQAMLQSILAQVSATLQTYLQTAMQAYLVQLPAQLQSAVSIDAAAFARAFQLTMTVEEIWELMSALLNPVQSTYEQNLALLGYADPAAPSQINIYPLNFGAKEEIEHILAAYNEQMEAAGEPDKVVRYTDLVGIMMSSVTDIVNMISYALIAFVAISLVVSSIMIGVITYISVLERKQEIGVLRAIGASKRDVRRVFNAETLLVGLVAGLFGILATLLLCIPANIIVANRLGIAQIAQLPLAAALFLIAVSMLLAFVAGLLPASAAARKDPVEALRSV